jgi:hypothetical protein
VRHPAVSSRPRLAYVLEPRFPGGTSSAVARELRAVAGSGAVEVHGITSAMFPGRPVAGVLAAALDDLGLSLRMDATRIAADRVIVHNPSFLKFDTRFAPRIVAEEIVLVTHENFLRPGGRETHDVARCLDLIDRASVALRKSLAPISPYNRSTVMDWLADHPAQAHWQMLEADWINICDFALEPPAAAPRDRRGRHSRPGFEKFPDTRTLDLCFPPHAEANVILGADGLDEIAGQRPHWEAIPFQAIDLASYFSRIDFMVYFTAPTFRESFGRVLAEGIAAGKVVITDADTGSVFGDAVVAARPEEVDAIIAGFLAAPDRYAAQVRRAQARLETFSAANFLRAQARVFAPRKEAVA